MKIILAIPYNPLEEIGGLEIGTVRLAKSLERIGHKTKITTIGKSGSIEGVNIDGKQNMAELCEWLIKSHKGFDVLNWMEIFPNSGEIEMQCLTSGLLRSFGKKVFLMVATSENLKNRGGTGFTKNLVKNTMDGYIISNSGQITEFNNYGIENNIHAIGFGLDTENIFYPVESSEKIELRKKLNLPLNKTLVLFMGRFVERKRPIFLFETWQNLSDIYQNTVLVVVGSGMGQHDSIENQAIEMSKKCKNIILREFSHDLIAADYFRASDIFVLPSNREGQPNVMLEAMASGIPVIGSAIPGIIELLENGKNGLTFSVNDSDEFASLIKKLVKSEKNRKELGRAGRKLICREKSLDCVARQYQALYEK